MFPRFAITHLRRNVNMTNKLPLLIGVVTLSTLAMAGPKSYSVAISAPTKAGSAPARTWRLQAQGRGNQCHLHRFAPYLGNSARQSRERRYEVQLDGGGHEQSRRLHANQVHRTGWIEDEAGVRQVIPSGAAQIGTRPAERFRLLFDGRSLSPAYAKRATDRFPITGVANQSASARINVHGSWVRERKGVAGRR